MCRLSASAIAQVWGTFDGCRVPAVAVVRGEGVLGGGAPDSPVSADYPSSTAGGQERIGGCERIETPEGVARARWAAHRQWPLRGVGVSLERDALNILDDVCGAGGKEEEVKGKVEGDLKK